jgi:hypothetical protein
MKFSNMYGLKSKSVIDALSADGYDMSNRPDNVYSATEIIDAPKGKVLFRRHKDEIVVDVSDNFHMMDGSAVHYAVEMSNLKSEAERLSEERIFIRIPAKGKWEAFTLPHEGQIVGQPWYNTEDNFVSVKFDNYEVSDAVIEDYKRTSVWETVYGLKESRTQQLNIGAVALRMIGYPVHGLRACLFLKDWSNKELRAAEGRGSYYPAIPYKEVDCALWSEEEAKSYISERLSLHVAAKSLKDDEIPHCTEDERWYRGASFAVMKVGGKIAKKVFKVEGDVTTAEARRQAEIYLADISSDDPKSKYVIEDRPGQDTRCYGDKVYCSCRQWCHYWKEKYSSLVVGAAESEY